MLQVQYLQRHRTRALSQLRSSQMHTARSGSIFRKGAHPIMIIELISGIAMITCVSVICSTWLASKFPQPSTQDDPDDPRDSQRDNEGLWYYPSRYTGADSKIHSSLDRSFTIDADAIDKTHQENEQ